MPKAEIMKFCFNIPVEDHTFCVSSFIISFYSSFSNFWMKSICVSFQTSLWENFTHLLDRTHPHMTFIKLSYIEINSTICVCKLCNFLYKRWKFVPLWLYYVQLRGLYCSNTFGSCNYYRIHHLQSIHNTYKSMDIL